MKSKNQFYPSLIETFGQFKHIHRGHFIPESPSILALPFVFFSFIYPILLYVNDLLNSDTLIIAVCMFFLALWNNSSRKFLYFILPFLLSAIVYDSMRYIGHEWRINIHIEEPYQIEKNLFGIVSSGIILTPNEYLRPFYNSFLDVFCGIGYLTFVLNYILFCVYFYMNGLLSLAKKTSWCFFVANFIGVIIYHLYPAAPPWYVDLYGFDLNLNVPPNPAGAIRFDEFFNINVFQNMYSKSTNVFAAIPSLHVAYPFLFLFFSFYIKRFRLFAILYFISVSFGAVYLFHHYIIDILIGYLVAIAALLIIYPLSLKKFTP